MSITKINIFRTITFIVTKHVTSKQGVWTWVGFAQDLYRFADLEPESSVPVKVMKIKRCIKLPLGISYQVKNDVPL